jgi:hypothetical protein
MKRCKTCGTPKNESEFAVKRNSKVNLNCSTCINKVRDYYNKNKVEKRRYQLARYHDPANKQAILDQVNEWHKNNPTYVGEYFATRKATDALFKLKVEAPARLRWWALGTKKVDVFQEELGCTPAQLRSHLEALFQPGMTWDNPGRGSWVLDHIFPLSIAYKAGEAVLRKALKYRNVRPVWEKDNYSKSVSLPKEYPSLEAFIEASKDW